MKARKRAVDQRKEREMERKKKRKKSRGKERGVVRGRRGRRLRCLMGQRRKEARGRVLVGRSRLRKRRSEVSCGCGGVALRCAGAEMVGMREFHASRRRSDAVYAMVL
jgi:hypothetical protein